jgi:hypothetical protein
MKISWVNMATITTGSTRGEIYLLLVSLRYVKSLRTDIDGRSRFLQIIRSPEPG